jgi:hypothetical protein
LTWVVAWWYATHLGTDGEGLREMRRLAITVAMIVGLLIPASASAATPPGASGTGTAGPWTFNFNAIGDASALSPAGGPATGFATVSHSTRGSFSGPVTCLAMSVDARNATIGVTTAAGRMTVVVFDSKGFVDPVTGEAQLDNFGAGPEFPNFPCASMGATDQHSLESGDVVVSAGSPGPTSKDQCKNGGWSTYGVFKNQGDCVSFVATGGKKEPAGSKKP